VYDGGDLALQADVVTPDVREEFECGIFDPMQSAEEEFWSWDKR
jgi:hypothetical protein